MQQVEIRVKGRIDEEWSQWFGDLTISYSEPDETALTGLVPDQAFYGLIARLRNLGLQLCSVSSEEVKDSG